jgi:hypothetical protein
MSALHNDESGTLMGEVKSSGQPSEWPGVVYTSVDKPRAGLRADLHSPAQSVRQ